MYHKDFTVYRSFALIKHHDTKVRKGMADEFQSDLDFALGAEHFESEEEYRLHCLKHSTSHIMAYAVQQLFPEVKFGIGPPIKNGFYYDMELPRPLTPEDLEEIEQRMKKIVKEGLPFHREDWQKDKAMSRYSSPTGHS